MINENVTARNEAYTAWANGQYDRDQIASLHCISFAMTL